MPLPNQLPSQTSLYVNPVLTAIAVTYTNRTLIADQVAPRVPVMTPDFKYTVWNKKDDFTIPETLVGRKGYVNEVEVSEDQATASVEDHFIDAPLPRRDAQVAAAYNIPFSLQARKTQSAANKLALAREQRLANLMNSPASYASGNATTLTGNGQWSSTSSSPLNAIIDQFDSMLIRPNTGVMGRQVLSQLQRNPNVVAAFHANQGTQGIAPVDFIKEQLGLTNLYIGESWFNAANIGQTGGLSRLWGKNASFYYQDAVSEETDSMSFVITAQWGERITSEYFDEKRGGRGTDVYRVGEAVKELILAPDLGYLYQNAVA